jgi:hypothetical protein
LPVSAGVFGILAGTAVIVLLSCLSRAGVAPHADTSIPGVDRL